MVRQLPERAPQKALSNPAAWAWNGDNPLSVSEMRGKMIERAKQELLVLRQLELDSPPWMRAYIRRKREILADQIYLASLNDRIASDRLFKTSDGLEGYFVASRG